MIATRLRQYSRVIWLAALPLVVGLGVTGVTLLAFWDTARADILRRQEETASLIAGVLHSLGQSARPIAQEDWGDLLGRVLSPYLGSNGTREWVAGRRRGSRIEVLGIGTDGKVRVLAELDDENPNGIPLRLALAGHTGSGEHVDYRGVPVLAGYAPIPSAGLGIVVKLETAAARAPYLRAGRLAAAASVVAAAVSGILLARSARRAAIRLQGSQARLSSLSESVPAIVLVLTPAGRIEYVNSFFEEVTGYSRTDVLGSDWFERFIPANERERTRAEFRQALAGRPTRGKVTALATRQETPRQIEWNDQLLRDGRGGVIGLLAVGTDVTERDAKQQALWLSEARLRRAERGTNDGLWEWDTVTGAVYHSDRWHEMLGYEPGDLRPHIDEFTALLHPDDRDRVSTVLEAHLRGEAVCDMEIRLRCKDGRYRWVRCRGEAERGRDGTPTLVSGTITDIEERKQAEAALIAERDRLRQILDSLVGFACVLTTEGELLEINQIPLDAAGQARADVLGHKFDEIGWFDAETRPRVRELVAVAASGERACIECVGRFAVLGSRDIAAVFSPLYGAGGAVVGVIGFGIDVSEQKRAEQRLIESEARMRAVVEGAFDAITIADGETRRFTFGNPSACRILGVTPEALLRMGLADIHPPDSLSYHEARFDAIAGGQSQVIADATVVRPDGTLRTVDISASGVVISGRRCVIAVVRDTTDRHRAEAELRASRERLRLFIEYAPAGVAVLDRELRYLAYSRRWLSDYGLVGQNLLGRSHYEVFPEIPSRWRSIYERCLRGTADRCEQDRFDRQDGTVIWLRWEIQPWREPTGEVGGLVFLTEDITARVTAEQALRRSERRLLEAQALAKLGDWEWDLTSGRLLWSPQTYRLFGVDPDEFSLTPESFSGLVLPDDRERLQTAYRDAVAARRPYQVSYRVRTSTGAIRHIEERAETEYAPDGNPVVCRGSVQDVTARVEAEEQLRISEARLREAVRCAGIGIFDHDHVTGAVYLSSHFRALLEIGPDEPVFVTSVMDRVHPDDQGWVREGVRRAHDPTGDGAFDVEHRILLSDGRVRWLLIRSKTEFGGDGVDRRPVRTYGAGIDFTDRKLAEEALRASEERFRTYVDNSPLGVFVTDLHGRYLDVNPAGCRLSGYTREELLARSVADLSSPDGAALDAFRRALADGAVDVELPLWPKTGEAHWVAVSAVRLAGDRVLAFAADIQERVRSSVALQMALAELRHRLEQLTTMHAELDRETQRRRQLEGELADTHRLLSVSALAGGVAHELNQPLTAILNYVAGCLRRLPPIEVVAGLRESLREVEVEARRAVDIIQALRNLFCQRLPELGLGDVNAVVVQAADIILPVAEVAGVRVNCTLAGELPALCLDSLLITQAVLNLLSNAIEAMEHTSVEERVVELETAIDSSGAVRVGVHDRGAGLPAAVDLGRAFRTTKPGGMGLGLPITRNLVELHSGRLWATPRAGGGTSFYFTLGLFHGKAHT